VSEDMSLITPAAPAVAAPGAVQTPSLRTAHRVFRGSLYFTIALTLVWLFFIATQRNGGWFTGRYNIDRQAIGNIIGAFIFYWVFWGFIWYGIRWLLMRYVAGFSRDELRAVFRSRMKEPFDVSSYLTRHSERTIRIIDMVGRRGRYITIGLGGFLWIHNRIGQNPTPELFVTALQGSLTDSIFAAWLVLAAYYSNGFFGKVVLGAQSRLMDGTLARANATLIMMLWHAFRFIMVPLGVLITGLFPVKTYAAVFAFIWLSYQVSDALSEIIGSLLGKQKLRVWGLGDVNRKSVAGTWACFVGSMVLCLWIVWLHSLPWPWLVLAVIVSISNTALELFSPRGTDDFTMATANALLCCAFGALVY
jgi:hypothetical protein